MGQGSSSLLNGDKEQLTDPLKQVLEDLQSETFPCPEGLKFGLADGREIGYSEYIHPSDASVKASDLDVVLQ